MPQDADVPAVTKQESPSPSGGGFAIYQQGASSDCFAIYQYGAIWGIGSTFVEAATDAEEMLEGGDLDVLTIGSMKIKRCSQELMNQVCSEGADQWQETEE